MRRFSSVAAFVAEYAAGAADDPLAAEILAALDPEARRGWRRERTGHGWSAAWLAHVEQRVFVHLRRALRARGMWRP